MGVYITHHSMSCARYVGRDNIFQRLAARKKAQELDLRYFSFYGVKNRKHEREIESLLIRAAGPLLQSNTKEKRLSLSTGSVKRATFVSTSPVSTTAMCSQENSIG